MRRLIVSEFVTVDGVMEAPGFDEHRSGRNAWALRLQDEELQRHNKALFFAVDGILMGRTTYNIWAAFWPTAPGDPEFARRINEMPKYVVSRTLEHPEWSNTTVLRGDIGQAVAALKEQPGGDILVQGSADLVDELLRQDLVDEYQLQVFPVILGSGKHLFRDEIALHHLRLVRSRTFPRGVVLLVYEPEAQEPTSPYVEAFAWTPAQTRSWQAARDITRVLATVLFTDIVDSTLRAAAVGDRAWRSLLDRHDQVARREVNQWHGEVVKSTGDGILATFDAPTRALGCAVGLREALREMGLEIRAAIHTGEVERREGDVGGIGVHIASRALAEAAPGQVVVTRTVRDLATGTDLAFAPLGSVTLRGVPGAWELFEARLEGRGG